MDHDISTLSDDYSTDSLDQNPIGGLALLRAALDLAGYVLFNHGIQKQTLRRKATFGRHPILATFPESATLSGRGLFTSFACELASLQFSGSQLLHWFVSVFLIFHSAKWCCRQLISSYSTRLFLEELGRVSPESVTPILLSSCHQTLSRTLPRSFIGASIISARNVDLFLFLQKISEKGIIFLLRADELWGVSEVTEVSPSKSSNDSLHDGQTLLAFKLLPLLNSSEYFVGYYRKFLFG